MSESVLYRCYIYTEAIQILQLFRNIQRFTPQTDQIPDIKTKAQHKPDVVNNIASTYCFVDEGIIELNACGCTNDQPEHRNRNSVEYSY